jgi:hypothetical protein
MKNSRSELFSTRSTVQILTLQQGFLAKIIHAYLPGASLMLKFVSTIDKQVVSNMNELYPVGTFVQVIKKKYLSVKLSRRRDC